MLLFGQRLSISLSMRMIRGHFRLHFHHRITVCSSLAEIRLDLDCGSNNDIDLVRHGDKEEDSLLG